MKRFYGRLGMAVAALALAGAPALAGQRPNQDSGSTPASDRAVERGSGSGGSAGTHNGGGGSAVSGGSGDSVSSSPSAGAAAPTFGGADRHAPMYAEPQRRGGSTNSGASGGSRRGGGSGGERAVPRGSGSSGSSGTSKSGNDSTTSSSSAGSHREAPARENGEVPSWSRPRGDRPATGSATQRVGPPPDRDHNGGYYSRYYDPYYPYYGYGYGLGYGLYGSYYPGFGLGYGYGLPLFYDPWYDPYGGYGYAGGGGGYYSGTQYASVDQGKVRLKVKPRQAKVYVDGYFVGDVDQFDGTFQKLTLNGGRHHVEIKADGYETAEFDVMVMPDQTITYAGELKRIQ